MGYQDPRLATPISLIASTSGRRLRADASDPVVLKPAQVEVALVLPHGCHGRVGKTAWIPQRI